MKLYAYDIYTRSRGYSFDHPTNVKGCIDRTLKIYNRSMYNHFLYNNLSIIRRVCYPVIILDIGLDKIIIHISHEELNLYQRRYILNRTLFIKLGSILIYKGKWK